MLTALAVAAALAAPTGLARVSEEAGVALAGDHVLFTRTDERRLEVYAVPIAGGTPRRVFEYEAPEDLYPRPALSASPQRAVLSLQLGGPGSDVQFVHEFGGPPLGPYTELTPRTEPSDQPFPWTSVVDGPNLFTYQFRGGFENVAVVHEGRDLPLPPGEAITARFGGDFVASTDLDRTVTVRNWRTGATHTSARLRKEIEAVAVRPDGTFAAATDDGVFTPRRLTRATGRIAWAGDHLLLATDARLRMVAPTGRVRAFGTTTEELAEGFATDDRHVAWVANRCLLVAPITAAAAPTPAAGGPCPRSEFQLSDDHPNLRLNRRLTFHFKCVTAPRACTGTVQLRLRDLAGDADHVLSRKIRFTVRAGRAARIPIRLTESGFRTLRRFVAADEGTLVQLHTRTDDGDTRPNLGQSVAVEP